MIELATTGSGMVPQANMGPANNGGSQSSPNNAPNINITGQFNVRPVPPAMTQTFTSATGGGAVAKTVYFLNEDAFNVSPTNNGSGADTIVKTYGDGWSGLGYNNLASYGEGIQCFGFTIEFVTTSTGAQNSAGITTANPTLLAANLVGNAMIPRGLVLSAGDRNTQYLAGRMTIAYNFMLNPLNQLSYNLPVGNTVTLTVMTQPF